MFTGIISDLGEIEEVTASFLTIQANQQFIKKLKKGESVAVNGICLTAVNLTKDSFRIDFIQETARRTNVGSLKQGDLVNLELPATMGTFLSGHLVQGHVDGVVKLLSKIKGKNNLLLKFLLPRGLGKYLVEKGAVAVNGISLTVIEAKKRYFTVGIIPFTLENTMLRNVQVGDELNIEADILAKYAEKLLKK